MDPLKAIRCLPNVFDNQYGFLRFRKLAINKLFIVQNVYEIKKWRLRTALQRVMPWT